jgi:hypothetical protein
MIPTPAARFHATPVIPSTSLVRNAGLARSAVLTVP